MRWMRLYRSSSCSLTEGCRRAAACSRSSMVSSSAELPGCSPTGRQGEGEARVPIRAGELRLCPSEAEPWRSTFLPRVPQTLGVPPLKSEPGLVFPLAFWLTSGAGEWLTFLQILNPAFEGSRHGVRAEGVEVRACQLGRAVIQHVHQAHRGFQLESVVGLQKESFTRHALLPPKASPTSLFCTLHGSPASPRPKPSGSLQQGVPACDGAQNTELGGTVLAHPHEHQLVKSLGR